MNKVAATSDSSGKAVEAAILALTAAALILRVFVPASVLNLFVDYTNEGGIFFVKFHLAAYLIIGLLLFTLFARPFVLRGSDVALFKGLMGSTVMILALTALIVVMSGVRATGFLIDTYLVAVLAGLLLLTQTSEARSTVGEAIITVLVLSTILALFEVVLQRRLLPFTEGEPVFRPIGLAGHPLSLGTQIVMAIGFLPLTRWRLWLKVGLTFLLFVGLAASGARLAMIAGTVEILLILSFSRWGGLSARQERKAKFLTIATVLLIGAVLLAVLVAGGLLKRFDNGIVDDNFMARVKIYQIFQYASWRDIMMGVDADALLALVREKLDLPFIESAPVYIILTLGLPAAIAFTAIIVIFFKRLLSNAPVQARIATLVFIVVELSSNGFSTKNPDIVLLTSLVVAFLHPAVSRDWPARSATQHARSTTSSVPARFKV